MKTMSFALMSNHNVQMETHVVNFPQVCCSDGVHCCPNGYTCDVSEGTCTQESKSIPMLTKLSALKKTLDENNVICPDGQSQCPDGNTCCKLSSGQWGCCPLPKAVCCSDGVHCCPNGYTCDVSEGTCTQKSGIIPMLTKLPASKKTLDENTVVCPDGQSQCPDGNTCCKLSSGQWGCCPLPKAVCCSDGVHCCPNGYTCDVSEGTCTQKSGIIPMLTNLPALKKTLDENSVVCPDGQSQCPDGNTCCKLSSGQWGCCPLPNAVCCSDGVHCCPNGYTCDVSEGTCTQKSKSIPMLTKLSALKKTPDENNVICPDGQSQCPDGNTCCKLSSGQWGCCPLPNAVCCSDGVHCCPNGYTCDVSEGTCTQEEKSIRMLTKLRELQNTPDENNVICPDGQSQCPDGNTCCKLSSGQWGCCPLPNAVCCSDGVHCCPNGYTCDVSEGTCTQKSGIIPMLTKLPALKKTTEENSVVCPDGQSQCPDGNTCCKLSSGQWGCCPLPNAVCCSDGVHCCPNGYTCDVSEGTCTQKSGIIPMLTKLPALKKTPDENSIVCPDGQSECPDGNTCCKLSSGQWGCCPLPNAVCCSDGVHCCPNGYTCDVSEGTCTQNSGIRPMLTKLPALKKTTEENSVVCPDGQSQCPDRNTCCKLSSGQWGCCPLPKAVCCSDGVHCCPNGYTCDVSEGTCTQEEKSIPMLTKLTAVKKTPDENSVVCPDGQSQCPDGNTCCKLPSGQWGCCPLPKAVCCSDGVHCCPNGYTCDVSEGTCSQNGRIIPMLTKLSPLKKTPDVNSVVCPDGESQCPDGNTCCQFSWGRWGCCPFPKAVCCSDGVHCCRNGYTCDVSKGTCNQEGKSIPMLSKLPALKKTLDENSIKFGTVEKSSVERAFDGIVCPDKKYQCPKGNTCCKLPSGTFGCCPLEDAVCCSDGKHCCPKGYTCDVKEG